MRHAALGPGLAILLATAPATSPTPVDPPGASCAGLARLTITGVSVTRAEDVPAGRFSPPGGRPLTVDAFCRVEVVAVAAAPRR